MCPQTFIKMKKINIYEVSMKNCELHLRLSKSDYDLISDTAKKMDMTISHLILSVLIPYCLRSIKSND